ncbi:MAG: hypothetical protein J5606_08900 [Bacteroidales bacterium]|nr:hypothetical protein [Bacteroidales bacterium]
MGIYAFRLIAKRDIETKSGKKLLLKGRCIEFDQNQSCVGSEDVKREFKKLFGDIPQLYSMNGDFEMVKLK